jgi:hypothetical protein
MYFSCCVLFLPSFLLAVRNVALLSDRLCGLVVRVLGYRSGGPGSIPGTARKKSRGSGTGSTQPRERVQLRSYLIENYQLLSRKPRIRP